MEVTWPFPTKIQSRYGIVLSQPSCPKWVMERAWLDLLSPGSCATPAEFEGTGPKLNLSGRHRMLCLDKHCSKQHKIAPVHMDSACTCYLQLPWTVTELTASLFWGVFREYVRLSNGVEPPSCNPNNILSLHEY